MRPWSRSQGAQADELGQIGDGFQRATATGAQVINVIGRWPVAPYACAAGQASGMRHAHAFFGADAASGGPLRGLGATADVGWDTA
jgi:hypothetical protein